MTVNDLIKKTKTVEIIGDIDVDITGIKIDSNLVVEGDLFICLRGSKKDGHDYVKRAQNYGAKAIVCERKLNTYLPQIVVKNSRVALSEIAREFYCEPDKKLKIIGVVGTNGKTTTSYMIKQILDKAGHKVGLIGTLGVFYNDKVIAPSLTTPDPLELYKIFSDMVFCGVEYVVMEVSAHAIYLDKVKGINFEVGLFTNFSQDHLDFFGDMKRYKEAKLKFFKQNKINYVVTNSDDVVGREICTFNTKSITYGIENPADVFAIDVIEKQNGCAFVINLFDCVYDLRIKTVGIFNVYNALCASCACALLGVKTDDVISAIKEFKGVDGRLEKVLDKPFKIFIDYAHTPDGLEKSLTALKQFCKKRLICVFGCGGNRDANKRYIMGKISGERADFTIITSDNPRYEEPMEIICQIERGVYSKSKKFVCIENRVSAISYAINMANEGDVILIAGKGAEKYQEILGIKHEYNDKDTVKEILRRELI